MVADDPLVRSRRWRVTTIVPYLLAHFAKSQLWHASTLLFAFFLTEACGLSVGEMGAIMAGSLILNAGIDAVLGLRWRTTVADIADAARLQALGAPVTGWFFVLFCGTPLLPYEYRLGWGLVTLLGFRASYPFVDVAQNAVVALAALDDEARCALLAGRNIASGLAALVIGGLAAPLLTHRHESGMWLGWGTCIATIMYGTAWWLGRTKFVGRAASPTPSSDTATRLPFIALLAALAIMMTGTATFRTLEPYHAAFSGNGAGLLFWAAIGGLASQILWLAGRRRLTFINILVIAAILSGMAGIGLLRGTAPGAVIAGLAFGMATGGVWLVLWSAMMSVAATGNATGYVGVFTGVSKCAQALALMLLSRVLASSPYRDTLSYPWSAPSLLMVYAIGATGVTSLALAVAYALNRTTCDGTPATPRRAVLTIPVPDRRRR